METLAPVIETRPKPPSSLGVADLRNSAQGLSELVKLYFTFHGQTKYVAQHLGVRRNTVITIITEKMIPFLSKLWIKECQGDVAQLAQRLGFQDHQYFHKTLRWHQRFDHYITSIDVDSKNSRAIAKALHFLRNIPEPLSVTSPHEASLEASCSKNDFMFWPQPGTDNAESISRKITKLKTMKFGTMMILGETGAGKGWLARRIYDYLYPKEDKLYLHLNCAHLISATVELFGSVKGAFTDAVNKPGAFELIANGGVLFLDEIDALPIDVQMKLLLVLGEEGVFYRVGSTKPIFLHRFTLITATNQDLEAMASNHVFRRDLLGRINQPCIRLKTWHQQPLEVRFHIIHELQHHISENDFEPPYADQLQNNFQLSKEQMEILLHSHYTYNIRSVRKQITEFMAQFLLESGETFLKPFQFQ